MQKIMKATNQKGLTTFWGISVILIEAVVVFFVFYVLYFFWIENPTPTSDILIIRAVKHASLSIPKDIDAQGWLSYSHDTFGISFRYAGDYQVAEDEITYGQYTGRIISLQENQKDVFSLHIFTVDSNETIPVAFQRLTNVNPGVYQSYTDKIDGHEAIIYRQNPGKSIGDKIYFIGNGYIFESDFNQFSANILATFTFTQK